MQLGEQHGQIAALVLVGDEPIENAFDLLVDTDFFQQRALLHPRRIGHKLRKREPSCGAVPVILLLGRAQSKNQCGTGLSAALTASSTRAKLAKPQ